MQPADRVLLIAGIFAVLAATAYWATGGEIDALFNSLPWPGRDYGPNPIE